MRTKLVLGCLVTAVFALAAGSGSADKTPDDGVDSLLKEAAGGAQGLTTAADDLLQQDADDIARKALSRVKLVESEALQQRRKEEPEPGPGNLIYQDDFESYPENETPKHWQKGVVVVTVDTPTNKTKVLKLVEDHAYLAPDIHASNFRLTYDFLCGQAGEVTWLARLHGHSYALWHNDNYYQVVFGTAEGNPLRFGVTHLWTGSGYPFDDAVLPAATIPQPSYVLAWHTADVIMDDDRLILKLDGTRVLDGHYPVLMARTRKDYEYGFGMILRDAYPGATRNPWVYYDWYDNIEIHDLGTPVRERRWPGQFHVASWGDDANTGIDPAHPWRTLKRAFAALRQGDQLTLQGGIYDEPVEWIDPTSCEWPSLNAVPDRYPTTICATPTEEVTLTAPWHLKNPGTIHLEDLQFSGDKASLAIEGRTGTAPALLKRLTFGQDSAGLSLNLSTGSVVVCGRAVFKDCRQGLHMGGQGKTDIIRAVFVASPLAIDDAAQAQTRFIHCTGIGMPAFPAWNTNCLSFTSRADAAHSLVNPDQDRFDPQTNAACVDAGVVLPADMPLPAFATMAVVGKPDVGAFECYPPRRLTCVPPAVDKEELALGLAKAVPIETLQTMLQEQLGVLRPGDTLAVGPGLWTEGGVTFDHLVGEPYAPIRIVSDPPLAAAIHGSVGFRSCDQLYVEGFRFAGYQGIQAKACSLGLNWRGCGRTFVSGCEITEYGFVGVGGEEQCVTLLRNWIHHNGRGGRDHGIYWTGEGPAWVIGNAFYGNSGWGYHNHAGAYNGWQAWKHVVHHNLFLGGNAMVTTGSRGQFYNNTVIRSGVAAFWFYNSGHRDNRMLNNICYESKVQVHTNDGNVFDHNLVTDTNTFAGSSPIRGDPQFVEPTNNDFRVQSGSPAMGAGVTVGLDDAPHPTLGAYDGHEAWEPPKPLPPYVPPALMDVRKKMEAIQPAGSAGDIEVPDL